MIGCAIARALSENYKGKFAILEKERFPGLHASGRNSGVVHSGFYYKPGSLKAKFSVDGSRRLIDYCSRAGVPVKTVGSIVIGRSENDLSVLRELERRGKENGVPGIQVIGKEKLRRLEPHVAETEEALYSPQGGIVDSSKLVISLAEDSARNGVDLLVGQRLQSVDEKENSVLIETNVGRFESRSIINCAGQYADRVAQLMSVGNRFSIIPFRGEYFRLRDEKSHLLRSMIYPAPDLNLPFLGIHLTKTIDGGIIAGPNAVLAPGREAYVNNTSNLAEIRDMVMFKGFWPMAIKNLKRGVREIYQSLSKRAFLQKVRELIPEIDGNDLLKWRSGIRAQLVDRDGRLVDDLVTETTPRSIHILNAVSPGMTCCLPFADSIVQMAGRNFEIEPIKR